MYILAEPGDPTKGMARSPESIHCKKLPSPLLPGPLPFLGPTTPPTCSRQPFPAIAIIDLSLMLWKKRLGHFFLPLGNSLPFWPKTVRGLPRDGH